MLITVDGLDGCGKDTHALRIKEFLEARGEQVRLVSHPTGGIFGRLSRRALQGSGPLARSFATIFYTLDVLWTVGTLKRRTEGTTILVRYLLGTAYLPARLAPLGYMVFRKTLPFPNLAFFIDIEPSVAIRRIASRGHAREMFETEERLSSVRKVAKALVSQDWITIDNSVDGEAPFLEVETILMERISS